MNENQCANWLLWFDKSNWVFREIFRRWIFPWWKRIFLTWKSLQVYQIKCLQILWITLRSLKTTTLSKYLKNYRRMKTAYTQNIMPSSSRQAKFKLVLTSDTRKNCNVWKINIKKMHTTVRQLMLCRVWVYHSTNCDCTVVC